MYVVCGTCMHGPPTKLNIIFKQHLKIVNGGAGPLPRVRWVGLGWHMRISNVISANFVNQIQRLPVFECIG